MHSSSSPGSMMMLHTRNIAFHSISRGCLNYTHQYMLAYQILVIDYIRSLNMPLSTLPLLLAVLLMPRPGRPAAA